MFCRDLPETIAASGIKCHKIEFLRFHLPDLHKIFRLHVYFHLFSLCSLQVPDSFLEAKEELSLPVGDVSECRTKCRDETRFVCR